MKRFSRRARLVFTIFALVSLGTMGAALATPENGGNPTVTLDVSPGNGDNLSSPASITVFGAGFTTNSLGDIMECSVDPTTTVDECSDPIGRFTADSSGNFTVPVTVTSNPTVLNALNQPVVVNCDLRPCNVEAITDDGSAFSQHHISFGSGTTTTTTSTTSTTSTSTTSTSTTTIPTSTTSTTSTSTTSTTSTSITSTTSTSTTSTSTTTIPTSTTSTTSTVPTTTSSTSTTVVPDGPTLTCKVKTRQPSGTTYLLCRLYDPDPAGLRHVNVVDATTGVTEQSISIFSTPPTRALTFKVNTDGNPHRVVVTDYAGNRLRYRVSANGAVTRL